MNSMNNIKFSFKSLTPAAFLPLLLVINSCTKNFEAYNKDSNGITDADLQADFNNIGGFFPGIENAFVNYDYTSMQIGEYLTGGAFGGYFMFVNPNNNYTNYNLIAGWSSYGLFGVGYNAVMAQIGEIQRRGAAVSAREFWAVALILKVASMQKVTDIYGPVPYSHYGKGGTTVAYDSQEAIYNRFFSELDTAVNSLKAYIASFPGATPFQRFDNIYNGDYTKWLKFANSIRLRLAMQIVKADPVTAQFQAEKAVDPANGGVFTSNADNALTMKVSQGSLYVVAHVWGGIRVNAAIISYMNGYNDPRISQYFEPSTVAPGEYVGIRIGTNNLPKPVSATYSNVSLTNFGQSSPTMWAGVAEVNFLRAEGALRGWNMGGTAEEFYNAGIQASFTQWGAGDASIYINDLTSKPGDYVDPLNSGNNIAALSDINIKWDDAVTNEQKLERIITQKWIATFPDGTLAWSTFRRTGYPKLFPVVVNNSNGTISTEIQIRRMRYPDSEYALNADEVSKGVTLLGGPDNGGTRLWWDVDKPNF